MTLFEQLLEEVGARECRKHDLYPDPEVFARLRLRMMPEDQLVEAVLDVIEQKFEGLQK